MTPAQTSFPCLEVASPLIPPHCWPSTAPRGTVLSPLPVLAGLSPTPNPKNRLLADAVPVLTLSLAASTQEVPGKPRKDVHPCQGPRLLCGRSGGTPNGGAPGLGIVGRTLDFQIFLLAGRRVAPSHLPGVWLELVPSQETGRAPGSSGGGWGAAGRQEEGNLRQGLH